MSSNLKTGEIKQWLSIWYWGRSERVHVTIEIILGETGRIIEFEHAILKMHIPGSPRLGESLTTDTSWVFG